MYRSLLALKRIGDINPLCQQIALGTAISKKNGK